MRWIENYKVLRDPLRTVSLMSDLSLVHLNQKEILSVIDVAPPAVCPNASYAPENQLVTVLCPQHVPSQKLKTPKKTSKTVEPKTSALAPKPAPFTPTKSKFPEIKPEKTHSVKRVLMWYILQR